jgi:hypothetical protein
MTSHTKLARAFTFTTLAAATAAGCLASARNDPAAVSVVLDEVPAGLSCVRVKTVASGEDWRLYDVAPGSRAISFALTGLPEGAGTVGVEGFGSACRSVGPFAAARWTAPSQRLAESNVAPALHFVLTEAGWTRGAATELPGGILVTFSSIAGATSTADGGVTSGDAAATDPASGGAEGGAIDGDGGSAVAGGSGDSGGGAVAGGGADGGTSTSTTTCFGPVCVTLTGPSTGDAGLSPPDGGQAGGSTGLCIGSVCLVRRLADGGVPPGATCLGPICTVSAPVSGGDGGVFPGAGGTGPTEVCLGAVCVQLVPGSSGDASVEGDAGLPGAADGGSATGTCWGGICVFRPPADPDGGVASGGTQPVEVCGPAACVLIQRQGSADGGAAGGGGGSTGLASVCFGQSCVSLSLASGSGGDDAGAP